MTLYNISERYENILEVQNELTQGELSAILIDIEDEFNAKAENIVKVIRELDSQKVALENEISRMNDLKKRVETRKAWLNEYLFSNMKRIGVNSIQSDLFTIKIRNNPQGEEKCFNSIVAWRLEKVSGENTNTEAPQPNTFQTPAPATNDNPFAAWFPCVAYHLKPSAYWV